ncbi:hypothetical protein AB205_0049460 [Aquarana catesbeiana]|uniref:Uncharacterized protein n=1 Tax=Aquarana catesbeiana TaxID=8400 RepID=A0A2G9Q7Y6_AQUCT|nr:hypothetical protein AB205_0049460 [Aquarana catesbeiana]PIO11291.1 hypothetical protein AB205_0049460 [Aquarana catesbeiana]
MDSAMMRQTFPTMDLQHLSAAPVLFHQADHRVANHPRVRPLHPGTLVKGDSCRWICSQSWRICGHQRKGSWKGLRTFLRGGFRHCVRMHRKQKSPGSRWSSWLPSTRPSLVSLFKCLEPVVIPGHHPDSSAFHAAQDLYTFS